MKHKECHKITYHQQPWWLLQMTYECHSNLSLRCTIRRRSFKVANLLEVGRCHRRVEAGNNALQARHRRWGISRSKTWLTHHNIKTWRALNTCGIRTVQLLACLCITSNKIWFKKRRSQLSQTVIIQRGQAQTLAIIVQPFLIVCTTSLQEWCSRYKDHQIFTEWLRRECNIQLLNSKSLLNCPRTQLDSTHSNSLCTGCRIRTQTWSTLLRTIRKVNQLILAA